VLPSALVACTSALFVPVAVAAAVVGKHRTTEGRATLVLLVAIVRCSWHLAPHIKVSLKQCCARSNGLMLVLTHTGENSTFMACFEPSAPEPDTASVWVMVCATSLD
jgi:hypothetical protein